MTLREPFLKRASVAVLGLVAASVICWTGAARAVEHTKDSPETIRRNIEEKKAILLDVRTEDEWKEGHLAVARLLPLSAIQKGISEKDLDKSKIIYCHCRSGHRALTAAEILGKLGYDVRPLKAGYEDLLRLGFEKATTPNP